MIEKFQLRYFPPGINVIYKQGDLTDQKQLDLYSFNPFEWDKASVLPKIIAQDEKLLSLHQKQIQQSLQKISNKYTFNQEKGYLLKKTIKAHKQPLTNCLFSRYGDKFITASYDRTCKIWSSQSGKLISTLNGHKNAVFCIDFSRFSDRQLIATGSLDHSARIWSNLGTELGHLKHHKAQITCIKFNPNGKYLLTSSFDKTINVWDIQKSKLITSLQGHQQEVVKFDHNYTGDIILSCSYDYTSRIWDLKTKNSCRTLVGHQGQINCCKFQFTGQICATGSSDRTSILWDVGTGKQIQALNDHFGEIYDLDFNKRGTLLSTCSSDCSVNVYSTNTSALLHKLEGHDGEVTRVLFNPQGNKIITTGMDGIGRIWDATTGKNIGLLQGHSDEIFSCDINYFGTSIITCSKDNVCNIWELQK